MIPQGIFINVPALTSSGSMGFLKELFLLTRFEHALMLAIAVLIGEAIIVGGLPPLSLVIVLSLLVPVFAEMGSFALNDYLDIETDKQNKKTDRPLVRGTISPSFALWFSIASLLVSIILAFFINTAAFAIAIAFNLLAVLYNWKLKDLPLIGNLYIALTMAIPFIFGNFVVSDTLLGISIILASLGFVSGLAREITKSVQDMEGDMKARRSKTLPVIIGAQNSLLAAAILYGIFVCLTILPFQMGLKMTMLSSALVIFADAAIIHIVYLLLFSNKDPAMLKKARNISLIALFIGLLGLLVSSF